MKSFRDYLWLSNSCSYDVIGRADRFEFQNFCSPDMNHTCHKMCTEICEIRHIFKGDLIKFCEIFTKISLELPQNTQKPLFTCKKTVINTAKCDLCLFLHKMCCKMVWKFCEIWKILWEFASLWAKFCKILFHSVRYGMYELNISFKGGYFNFNFFNRIRLDSPMSPWTMSSQSMDSVDIVHRYCPVYLDSLDFVESMDTVQSCWSHLTLSVDSLDFLWTHCTLSRVSMGIVQTVHWVHG